MKWRPFTSSGKPGVLVQWRHHLTKADRANIRTIRKRIDEKYGASFAGRSPIRFGTRERAIGTIAMVSLVLAGYVVLPHVAAKRARLPGTVTLAPTSLQEPVMPEASAPAALSVAPAPRFGLAAPPAPAVTTALPSRRSVAPVPPATQAKRIRTTPVKAHPPSRPAPRVEPPRTTTEPDGTEIIDWLIAHH